MKNVNPLNQPVMSCNVERDQNSGRLPVLRDLRGRICPHCGSFRYSLAFRVSGDGRHGILAVRCSRCREPGELTSEEIEREC